MLDINHLKSSSNVHNRERCPFCNSTATTIHWKQTNFRRCSSCELLFKNIMKTEVEVSELYKKGWLDPSVHKNMTGGTDFGLARDYVKKLAISLGLKNFSGLKILDFGAGRGDVMNALAELGADVWGVDLFGYDYLRSKGLRVFRTIEEIPENILFDGIITIDVIEHLFEPWKIIRRLFGLLNHNGWVCLTTPNAQGLNVKISRFRWRELSNTGHFVFFTPKSLQSIFAYIGCVRYQRLRWFVRYSNNPLLNIGHFLLQLFRSDGELRYLAWKR